jgi:uncharacterized cupin superfamily protein
MPEVIEEGTFDLADYEDELAAAPTNHDVGTKLVFENERVGVWEIKLQPGERGAFHIHDKPYFWTVVDAGIGRQRTDDGTYVVRRYEVGDTSFGDHSGRNHMIHDFENYGDTEIRFMTVELYA